MFQSTHPCGVRPCCWHKFGGNIWFQSTHPCGVRRYVWLCGLLTAGFNPRTRVGCDISSGAISAHLNVSIHAPVWGATRLHDLLTSRRCFNPRTRVGCDDREDANVVISTVSIHAPVWGATRQWKRHIMLVIVSIHAPVWGATLGE